MFDSTPAHQFKMNKEAQRIAIAKALGWRISETEHFKHMCRPGESSGPCCGKHLSEKDIFTLFLKLGDTGPQYLIPDFIRDLNAMHEAEKACITYASISERYAEFLRGIVTRDTEGCMAPVIMELCIYATAAQRAEAFLRTLGLWEEEK